ncbi:MAG: hypothetical protein QW304_08500 [Thermoproteota archaeon]
MHIDKTTVDQKFSHQDLVKIRLKAYRNGNWRRLTMVERALFKASIELAKLRGTIVSPSLISRLKTIALKLLQTTATKILQLGKNYANRLHELYSRNRVVKWFPRIRSLLRDPDYLLWLGVKQTAMRSIGICID